MAHDNVDVGRSLALAEVAIKKIKAQGIALNPRNFEIWYTYVEGVNEPLSREINEILSKNGKLTQADLTALFEVHLSQERWADQLDSVGSKVLEELDRLTSLVGQANNQATSYGRDLAGASSQLNSAITVESVRNIITALVQSTKKIEESNRSLEKKLQYSMTEVQSLQHNLEVVRNESLTDALTSLWNRKYYNQMMNKLIKQSERDRQPLSLIVADIDFFKRFNDIHGHLTGDQVLRLVGLSLKQNLKGQDVACRYGGEEFAVILPQTSTKEAAAVAEHIRRSVQAKELIKKSTQEVLGRVTISMGVATLKSGDTPASLYERADQLLYAAKRAGRNRVMCEGDLGAPSTA